MNQTPLQKDLIDLVTARLETAADDLRISIGTTEYTKGELLEHVVAGDDVGRDIVQTHLQFLKDMAAGKLYEPNTSPSSPSYHPA